MLLANKTAVVYGATGGTMVRYRVKADRAGENEAYIVRVFEQLDRERSAGIRYASFKHEDDVSFVHIVSVERADDRNP